MSDLEHRLAEDLALRDAALALFKADLAFLRTDLRERGLGARLADRLGHGTSEMVDDAVDYVEGNKGTVAAAFAAIVVWFARGPILDLLARLFGGEEEPADADGRSEED